MAELNPDVLYNMIVRLDEAALFSLMSQPGGREIVYDAVQRQTFWFERCEFLVGKRLSYDPEVDWRKLYSVLRDNHPRAYARVLDTVANLRAYEEARGPILARARDLQEPTIALQVAQELVYRGIPNLSLKLPEVIARQLKDAKPPNPFVVAYLIDLLVAAQNLDTDEMIHLASMVVKYGTVAMLDRLKQGGLLPTAIVPKVWLAVVRYGTVDMVKYMLSNFDLAINRSVLQEAVQSANSPVLLYLLQLANPGPEELTDLQYNTIVYSDSPEIYEILNNLLPIDPIVALTTLVKNASPWNLDMVRYLLSRIPSNADLSGLPITSDITSNVLLVLLDDPRIGTSDTLDRLLAEDMDVGTASIIAQSNAVDVFTLKPAQATRLAHLLGSWAVHHVALNTQFSLIVAYMVFKLAPKHRRDDSPEFLRWLISHPQLTDARAAADLVLHSTKSLSRVSDDVLAIRALLLSLLYPDMTEDEAINLLRRDGYSDQALFRSRTLLLVLTGG